MSSASIPPPPDQVGPLCNRTAIAKIAPAIRAALREYPDDHDDALTSLMLRLRARRNDPAAELVYRAILEDRDFGRALVATRRGGR